MQWLQQIIIKVMSIFYALLVVFNIVRQTFKLGFKTVWSKKTWPKPAALDDPILGTHGYLKLEDVRIHYVASGPEDKPLMLFLHGFPEFWFSWRHQIQEFQKDYRVVAIDQRGYGDSDKPAGVEPYEMSKLLSDIKQVIPALGYKSCVLVAHDWGGAVAWAFGRHFPDMVDKLIVMNAPSQPSFQKILHTSKAQQKMSWYIMFFQVPCIPELNFRLRNFHFFDTLFGGKQNPFQQTMKQEEIDAYKYTFSQPGALSPPINWYRAIVGRPKSTVRYDMDYVMPVLLIWGVKDMALHIDLVAQMEKDCPKMEVRRISEAGHFVQMDAPELVNKAMREWLEGGTQSN